MRQKLSLIANTVRHMRPKQIAFFAIRRGLPAKSVDAVAAPNTVALTLSQPIAVNDVCVAPGSLRFLNKTQHFGTEWESLNWQPDNVQRLWSYNLHYFDYLRDPGLPVEQKWQLLLSWVTHNPAGSRPGWEPFTTSLRICNWIFFLSTAQRPDNLEDDTLDILRDSLYQQARWLEYNDERHILANHYFENLKALLFAGAYFTGPLAQRWLHRAKREIKVQLVEQTLDDGGHFERSPQYHALMLENYLDILNLASSNDDQFSPGFASFVAEYCGRGLEWLSDVVFPDGKIPLFNDSAFGVAPELEDLSAYAATLQLPIGRASEAPGNIERDASGLYGLKTSCDMLIVDCGAVGPDYQPGHTHADFLSYELMLAGKRIVVDPGVCEYQAGASRYYCRSTAAHNTICVDGQDQSEVWGEFRVARRAQKLSAMIEQNITENSPEAGVSHWRFAGAFNGFPGVSGNVRHDRIISVNMCSEDQNFSTVTVEDKVQGRGHHTIHNTVLLHPDVRILRQQQGRIELECGDAADNKNNVRFSVNYEPTMSICIEDRLYHPRFNVSMPTLAIVFVTAQDLPFEMSYSFERVL